MIATILIILYCLVAFLTHCGIGHEYRKDHSGDLDEFSPMFIQTCLFCASLLWPILVVFSTVKYIKDKRSVK